MSSALTSTRPRRRFTLIDLSLPLFLAVVVVLFHAYLGVTSCWTRAHDAGWHLDYIQRIRETHQVPGPRDCEECTQPPLYYAIGAAWLDATANAGSEDKESRGRRIQYLDAAFGVGAACFFLLTIAAAARSPYERLAASALVAFWPTLYIESAKVGNDALLYLFAAGSIYFLVSWRTTGDRWRLVTSAVFAALAANTKTNGYVLVAAILGSLLVTYLRPEPGSVRVPRGTGWVLAIAALSVAATLFTVFHWKEGIAHPDWDGGTSWKTNVTNEPKNLLLPFSFSMFDSTFVRRPVGNFWEYLFRTGLLGEHSHGGDDLRVYASVVLACAGILVGFGLLGLRAAALDVWRGRSRGSLELSLVLFGFLFFLFAFRVRYRFDFHSDFRFILPILAPGLVFVARGFDVFRGRFLRSAPNLAAFPAWLVAVFSLAACGVIVSP